MFISDLSIRRPVVATVMMLTLVTLGFFSWRRLSIDLMPDVEIPVLSITTEYPGASPETVEREVSRRIEEAVTPISGVKHVDSISREGLSTVIVEFVLEVELNDVAQEARAKINAMRRELPAGLAEPVIQKVNFLQMPVVSLALKSDRLSPTELTDLADRTVKRRLESLPGIAKARLVGTSRREVLVNLDPVRMAALGMGVNEVVDGLAGENVNTPVGRLTSGGTELPLRISGKPKDTAAYADMVIARRGREPIRLSAVATVQDTIEERRSLALVNGQPAVAIDITKQTQANTVAIVDAVKVEIEKMKPTLPPGTDVQLVRDTSMFIRESVADVQNALVLGGLLTILIVFCFLNSWRSTVITGLTLPISVIASFIAMYFLGMTLNTLTLMALSLAIGILIDDAIVVRENIVRHLEHGEDHLKAAREGTNEIGLAVLATSLSIIAVFIPVAFMKGIIGRFFYQFGLTVAFAVLVSLFVSFTLDPMLSSRWHDPDIERQGRRNFLQRGLDRFNRWFERMADAYRGLIGWALDHRKTVIGLAAGAFFGGIGLFGVLPVEFQAPMDRGEFVVKFKSGPGSSFAETRGRLEDVLKALDEFPEVAYTYGSIAAAESDTIRDAVVFVKLVEKHERTRGALEIISLARKRLSQVPGIVASLLDNPDAFQKPLQLAVRGEDILVLKQYAAALKKELYSIPGVVDVEAGMEDDLPEYRLTVHRERAAASGLDSSVLANTLAVLVGGRAVTTYENAEGEAVDVRVRLPQALRGDVRQVADLKMSVRDDDGTALVPLTDLVSFSRGTSPAEIGRRDLSRRLVVDANLDGIPLGTAGTLALQAADKVTMQPGYSLSQGGDTEVMIESFGYLGEALLLAVIFVYLILAAQFESFIDPLSIMLSLPLSIVGMAGMLALTGDTINIMSLIGLIMLMGLVTKNAILLIDYTKILRSRGMDRREALVTAGRTRLRPIMMTTTAMIAGMLPLFFGLGEGAEFRAPMARAVVGGLITSTLLTLVVVPVAYSLLDDVSAWLFSRKKKPAQVAVAGLLFAAITAGGAQHALAQEQSVKTLTLAEALAIAAEHNRDVQKAREYRNWVQGKYEEERAAALPQAKVVATWSANRDSSQSKLFENVAPGGSTEITEIFGGKQQMISSELRVTQAIYTWGQVGSAIKAAALGIEVSQLQLERFRQAVARDVTIAYWNILAAKELARIAEADLAQKTRHLEEATRRQQVGTVTDYDVLAARVAVDNARPGVIRANHLITATRDQLRFLLAGQTPVDVIGTLDATVTPLPTYEELLTRAYANRPELAELKAQVGIYDQLIKITTADARPRVDFALNWGPRFVNLSSFGTSGTAWNMGIFATVPLFDGFRTKGRVAQTRSEQAQLRLDDLKTRDSIALDVRRALEAAEAAAAILQALSSTVQQAQQLLTLAEKGFELGVKTRLDVEDADLNFRMANGNLAAARRDYRIALVHLEWVVGTLGKTK